MKYSVSYNIAEMSENNKFSIKQVPVLIAND